MIRNAPMGHVDKLFSSQRGMTIAQVLILRLHRLRLMRVANKKDLSVSENGTNERLISRLLKALHE